MVSTHRVNANSWETGWLKIHSLFAVAILTCLTMSPAFATGVERVVTLEDFAEKPVYSPFAGRAYPDQVFFGDTHFHTNLSFDAGLVGTSLDVDAGYRFARGEMVISNTGQPVQLIRLLDEISPDAACRFVSAEGILPLYRAVLDDVRERLHTSLGARVEAFVDPPPPRVRQ